MVTMGMRVNAIRHFDDDRIYIDLNDLIAALALAPGFILKSELIGDLNKIYEKALKETE